MNVKKGINRLYSQVISSHFLRSVLTLSSGVVISQIVNFFGMPFIARVYSPAAIGDYAVITANANVIGAVACLGMMTALLLPDSDEEAAGLCQLVTYSTFLIATIAILGLWFITPFYRIFHTEEISYLIALIVLWLFTIFSIINSICYAYVNKLRMYHVMFWNPIINSCITVVISIFLGILSFGFIGYAVAHILAYMIATVFLMIYANPYHTIKNKEYILSLLKKYKRFPVYQMPANLIAHLGTQIPIQFIEAVYGATSLAMYSMALRILSLPTTLLATPINRIFFQEASQRYNRGEDIGEFSFKILETNIKIAIIPIILLTIFGREIFALFLGEQWRLAGIYAGILSIYQMMQFCASCLSGYFVIIRKNNWNFIYSFVILSIYIFIIIIYNIFFRFNVITFISIISIIMTLSIVSGLAIYFYYLNFDMKRYFLFLIKYILFPFIASISLRFLINKSIN